MLMLKKNEVGIFLFVVYHIININNNIIVTKIILTLHCCTI